MNDQVKINISSDMFLSLRWVAIAVILSLAALAGCYQRTVAPELNFDQTQVEALDDQLKKIDWE